MESKPSFASAPANWPAKDAWVSSVDDISSSNEQQILDSQRQHEHHNRPESSEEGHTPAETTDAQCAPTQASRINEKNASTTKLSERKLRRSQTMIWLVLAYITLAVFAWTITCILVHRPITAKHYGIWLEFDDDYRNQLPSHEKYVQSEHWLQVARFIQSVVAISTIPLTSAVCSSAAVVYMQRRRTDSDFTLRHTVVLADKGWVDLKLYIRLLCGQWKQYGSNFLYFAIALIILGSAISPLQSILITTVIVQTPTRPTTMLGVTDMWDLFGDSSLAPTDAIRLRSIMTSTSNVDPQSRLWSAEGATDCLNSSSPEDATCSFGQVSLARMSQLRDPFVAELPAGFSTGLVQQFLPRINSTARREEIDGADFPTQCDARPGSFYVNYGQFAASNPTIWNLIACMPANQWKKPPLWRDSHARQDFSEELYLNISLPTHDVDPFSTFSKYYKITINTTAGYFELPNYMNGQKPGALLPTDPNDYCGRSCMTQGTNRIYGRNTNPNFPTNSASATQSVAATYPATSINSAAATHSANADFALLNVPDKGPLLTIALALFGPGSFIAERVNHPKTYFNNSQTTLEYREIDCVESMPFAGLVYPSLTAQCVSDQIWSFGQAQMDILQYLTLFVRVFGPENHYFNLSTSDEHIRNGFEAAAFLSNQLLLTSPARNPSLTVNFDPGASIQAPHISASGIVLISVLLAFYLVSLLGLAAYSGLEVRWTARLDSIAMMQLGATIPEHLPLHVISCHDHIAILDQIPGSIGDSTDSEDGLGELEVGARAPLDGHRKYKCL